MNGKALNNLRPCWVEVNLDNLAHNLRRLRRDLHPTTRLMAVVKADAYGHGAVEVARAALAAGADYLGVAILDEALQLRHSGIAAPILVLGYTPPAGAEPAVSAGITLTVFDRDVAGALAAAGRRLGRLAQAHIKVDTGMGRIGLPAGEGAVSFIREATALDGLELEGVFTHFATADEPDKGYTREQYQRFMAVFDRINGEGIRVPLRHACNSAATLTLPQMQLDMVRPGLALYGMAPDQGNAGHWDLRPVMTWKARLAQVKTVPAGTSISYGRTYITGEDAVIGTLPVGYADGFNRLNSNRGEVLIGGRRNPVVGRVCMDQSLVKIDPVVAVCPGDEAVLLGRQGEDEISAEQIARRLGTINYEITCWVGRRVPRVYIEGGRVRSVRTLEESLT